MPPQFLPEAPIFTEQAGCPEFSNIVYKDVLAESITLERAACAIIEELGLETFPTCQFITMVLAPPKMYAKAFTVYCNHDLARAASDAAVKAVGEHLGFIGMPAWYPSGILFQWVEE